MNERTVYRDCENNEVVYTQSILNAKGPFGAIDTLAPNARLDLMIETAVRYRQENPDMPKRAAELAVDEVLRLRAECGKLQEKLLASRQESLRWQEARSIVIDSRDFWKDNYTWKCEQVLELQKRLRPWWLKLAHWFSSFAP